MHDTSALWKRIFAEPDHRKEIKVTINGTEYAPEDDRLIRASVTGQLFDAPSVGNCFSRTLDLTVMPLPGVNGYIPPLSEIKLFTRLVSADGQSVSEYVQKGVFYADTVKRDSDTGAVTVTAFDAMMKMERQFGVPKNGGYGPVETFTVSFDDGFRNIQKFQVSSGGALPTPTTPTHDGERFLAWYPDPANTPTVKGDMRFTAQWARKFAVTFDSNGGTPQTPQAFVCFDGDPTPTPETPEKAGYALSGWTPTPTETVTADADYTAQWEWERYVIAAYPAKSDYAVGETLDYAGLVVEERFEDGAAARDITADCVLLPAEGYEIAEPGDIMVSVGYNGATVGTFWAAVNIAYGGWWRLRENGTLEIYCVGDMPFYINAPWLSYADNITNVIIRDGVTSIGSSAFAECRNLVSATIPDSVTSISGNTFLICGKLTNVTLSKNLPFISYCMFWHCASLTSVTIPDSVTYIGQQAFEYCTSLTSVTIPDSVTRIDKYAFQGCSRLTSVTIPEGVIRINDYTFQGCSRLTSVTIPEGVMRIDNYAFANCVSLTSVTIPESVYRVGNSAFANCNSLTDVYYGGTEDEWVRGIYKDSGNSPLSNATIHYNSTGPT